MLPPPAANDLTSTPKKMLRLSQTKAAIDQAHVLEQSVSPVPDDDRDEIASNTSVAVNKQIFGQISSMHLFFHLLFRVYSNT